MKRIFFLVLGVLAIAAIWLGISRVLISTDESRALEGASTREYSSGEWLFAFEYPDTYSLTDRDLSTAQRGHNSIVLVDQAFVMPEGGEGPVSISVDVYQNAENERHTAESWIKGNSASNYKLGDGTLAPRTVAGHDGLEYEWSGLYEGRSVVVATADYIYMFSVTRIGEDDAMLADFDRLLASVRIGSF
jgi:hypothetical protein